MYYLLIRGVIPMDQFLPKVEPVRVVIEATVDETLVNSLPRIRPV